MPEERRIVTILFADVVGSTALGESRDAEDVRALMGRYYKVAQEIVQNHGGTVDKFMGDAVLAIFGLPVAHGDDAQRALSAALALREAVRNDDTLGSQFAVRLGVNTGEVVADSSASDFLISGDAVNVAARLQQTADPWDIVCGERTVRAAGAVFTFGPAQAQAARGKSQPVAVRRLVGRAAGLAPPHTALIGRDADLMQLELVAQRAFQEKRPFLVSVIAPAGVGKTRLVEEFLDRLPSSTPEATVAIAQCLPYGQRLTYWPLRAVLFRIVGIQEDAPPDRIRAAVAAWCHDEAIDRDALFGAWRGGGRRNYVSLALEPLPDTAVEALVEHLLGRPSSQVVARVVERADGNPFYAGEIVRAIMDRVPSLDDETTVSRTLAELPDTVQATVLARLDLLHPAERRVLQLGAVFGRTFRNSGIAALDPALAGQVTGLADRLMARDLIRPDGRGPVHV